MADIKITDLNLNGNDLFNDDEDFMDDMDELGEDIIERVKGGTWCATVPFPLELTPQSPFIL